MQDVVYLGPKGSRIDDPRLKQAANLLVSTIKFRPREIVTASRLPAALLDAADAVLQLGRPVLFSEETLATSATQLDYDRIPLVPLALARLFGDRLGAAIVLREPLAFIASLLLQKMWSRPHSSQATKTGGGWPGPRDILDLHLAAADRQDPRFIFTSACRYDRIIEAYRKALGPGLALFAYEPLFDERRLYRHAFSDLLGTAPADGEIGHENPSSEDKRLEMASRYLGRQADPQQILQFAAAWADLPDIVTQDSRLVAYAERHCMTPYAEALRATEALASRRPRADLGRRRAIG
ncbi:hypothetical protein EDC65_5230 [Stella humosa]|uniref:Sulfotransferase family protein n=2 Tax=Stella humosa TaxID=94 RepID=A0A3N1KPX7_9PROT|nr:hypothetical protein EDC65_5230 [Stella humosa]BBK32723.1 hypothetical protein STHU_33570 [Stella humosa]